MSEEEQGKKTSHIKSDAAAKEVIPAKPAGDLSEQDLDKVAGGGDKVSVQQYTPPPTIIQLVPPTNKN